MQKEVKNFFRIKKCFLRRQQRNDLNFIAFSAFSSGFVDFLGTDGTVFFFKKGLTNYLRVARGYWEIMNNKK